MGRFDLDESAEVVINGKEAVASRLDLPEAAGIEAWHDTPTEAERMFYTAMSPIALFWPVGAAEKSSASHPLHLARTARLNSSAGKSEPALKTETARGFSPHPFLPVLLESRAGASRLAWSSDASEFEVTGLAAGAYRARALDVFGKVTFASGIFVRPRPERSTAETRLWSKMEIDEPESRQVMGFVRWENGEPAPKAVVVMQNSYNFRKYLRRVEADEYGFFRFGDVPGNEPYFVFALPPSDQSALKNFQYFAVVPEQRECWRDVTIYSHRIRCELPPGRLKGLVELVRIDPAGEVIVLSAETYRSDRSVISNIPEGIYRVQLSSTGERGERRSLRSMPLKITGGVSEASPRWSETAPSSPITD